MPNLLNGLVNGWVKVNSKHVVFPKEEHRRERRGSDASSLDESSGRQNAFVAALDRSRGKSSNHRKHSPQTVTTASTLSSRNDTDPEADAIRKFNSKRQHKKGSGLQRTRSHSDLLREMASSNNNNDHQHSQREPKSSLPSNHQSHDNDESVRLVAGFFGSSSSHQASQQQQQQHPQKRQQPVTTGKYLNETMFVQQLSERSRGTRRSSASTTISAAESASTGGSDPSPSSRSEAAFKRQAYGGSSSVDSHTQLRHYPQGVNVDSRAGMSHAGRQPKSHAQQHEKECYGCREMENQLLAAYDDIRYLRDVSLRSEQYGAPKKSGSSILSRGSNHELTTLQDASKRLSEVTGRHRRQIEQMTRETSRKQHDIHFKHSKMSMICKTLNDESSIRKQEALDLEEEVRDLKMERDELATEVQRLRTEVSLHQQEQQEHALLRERMTSYENHSLERADEAIRERDQVIEDLSNRLERTLETLEIEREQQRQRRQIIFPGAKSADDSSSATDVATLQEELRKAKEAAKASEALLEATRADAAKREMALSIRCDELKREADRKALTG